MTEWPDTKGWPICQQCHNLEAGDYVWHAMIVLNMNTKMIHYQGDGGRDGYTVCGRDATGNRWLWPL